MMEQLLLPFELLFMQQAFMITLLISLPMALLSCYLVLKGWSLFGDAISHAVLPGVVIAYVINIPLAIGAFIAGMICALSSAYVSDRSRIKEDTALGIVFATMFGLGIVLHVAVSSDVQVDIGEGRHGSVPTQPRCAGTVCFRDTRYTNGGG